MDADRACGVWLDGEMICNADIQLVSQYSDPQDNDALWLLIEVQLDTQHLWLTWRASELDTLNLEREIPGVICVNSRGKPTKRLLATYLRAQINHLDCPSGRYIGQTGWHNLDGHYRFVIGESTDQPATEPAPRPAPVRLLSPNVASIRLADDPKMSAEYAVEKLLLALHRNGKIYFPLWGYTLFAVTRSFLQSSGIPTACILYIVGRQGLGKTTCAKNICQLFDRSDGAIADVYDAGSTGAAMRNALANARDRPVLLDDVCLSTNRSKQRERRDLAAQLIRIAANETPISKMAGGHEIYVSCAASLVVTGEIPMETPSDVTRCIMVQITEQMTDDTDELRLMAATAMRDFLLWFSDRHAEFSVRIHEELKAFSSGARPRQTRVQTSLFTLSWLLARFFDYAVEIGAISNEARQQLQIKSEQALTAVWENIETMLRKIEARPLSLVDTIRDGIQGQTLASFEHGGCVCLRTDDLTAYLRYVYNRSDITDRDVTAALRQAQLLSIDSTGKSTKKIKGKRYLCIPLTKL